MNRLAFFGIFFLFIVAAVFVTSLAPRNEAVQTAVWWAFVALTIGIGWMRLENAGMPGWISIGLAIPFLGILPLGMCLFCAPVKIPDKH